MSFWDEIEHFTPAEFQDPDVPDSGEAIYEPLVRKLDDLRERTGWKIIIHWIVGGAIDVHGTHGHKPASWHRLDKGAKAADWHFDFGDRLPEPKWKQFRAVEEEGFPGVGIYYHWKWNNRTLPIGFHTDMRPWGWMNRWVCFQKDKYQVML